MRTKQRTADGSSYRTRYFFSVLHGYEAIRFWMDRDQTAMELVADPTWESRRHQENEQLRKLEKSEHLRDLDIRRVRRVWTQRDAQRLAIRNNSPDAPHFKPVCRLGRILEAINDGQHRSFGDHEELFRLAMAEACEYGIAQVTTPKLDRVKLLYCDLLEAARKISVDDWGRPRFFTPEAEFLQALSDLGDYLPPGEKPPKGSIPRGQSEEKEFSPSKMMSPEDVLKALGKTVGTNPAKAVQDLIKSGVLDEPRGKARARKKQYNLENFSPTIRPEIRP